MMSAMDPHNDLTASLTLGSLALEMRERFDVVEAAMVFEAQQRWCYGDFMPLRRETHTIGSTLGEDHHVVECGMMRRGDGPVVTIAGGMPVGYASFDAMAEDGWRPD
jgi:hypothetical protein